MGTPVVVGRHAELAALEAAWVRAAAGNPQVVLLEGEAGVGKSTLARAFRGRHRDGPTLSWVGDDLETQLPYAMAEQLTGVETFDDPFDAGASLLAMFDELAADGPLVVALDDVHLSDRESLIALNFALRRLRRDRVLAVLTARGDHLDQLPGSIAELAAEHETHIRLRGLTTEEVRELAKAVGCASISRRAAGRLHDLTHGNPLYLTALISELPRERLEHEGEPLPAPRSFSQLVLGRFESVSAAARRVAGAAAVLGERCDVPELEAVAGLDTGAVLQAVDELRHTGILRTWPGATSVSFEHPLIRSAVYGNLGHLESARMHLAAATMLDGWPALRHRVAASHDPDPELAADLEEWARQATASGSSAAAAGALRAAYEVAPEAPDADRRLLAAATAYATSGDARAAQSLAESVRALPRTGARLAVQARLAWFAGFSDEAVGLGRQAMECEELDPSERDLVAAMLAHAEVLCGNTDDSIAWCTQALADERLPAELASRTRQQLALGVAMASRYDEAVALLDDLPDDPNEVPASRRPELGMRGILRCWEGPRSDALRDLVAASTWTEGTTDPLRLEAAASLGAVLVRSGEWDRAQALLLQTLRLAEDAGQTWMLGYVNALCTFVPAARGQWETAERHLAVASELASSPGAASAVEVYADDAAAFLAVSRGDTEAVVDATARLCWLPLGSSERQIGFFWWPFHRIGALVDLGRLDDAEEELARLAREARPGGRRSQAGVLRVSAQLAAARGDGARARAHFCSALAGGEDHVDVLERALTHELFGRFLRRRGERRDALAALKTARECYRTLGAAPFLERCERELAACGLRDPVGPPRADLLTPQERVVASLVCAGKTNRQVARDLVLSTKTIEFHLANVYHKLDVHSRAQLVAALLREGGGVSAGAPVLPRAITQR